MQIQGVLSLVSAPFYDLILFICNCGINSLTYVLFLCCKIGQKISNFEDLFKQLISLISVNIHSATFFPFFELVPST